MFDYDPRVQSATRRARDVASAQRLADGLHAFADMVVRYPTLVNILGVEVALAAVPVSVARGNVRDIIVKAAQAGFASRASVIEHNHGGEISGVSISFGPVRLYVHSETDELYGDRTGSVLAEASELPEYREDL